jgi:hypothetical protein
MRDTHKHDNVIRLHFSFEKKYKLKSNSRNVLEGKSIRSICLYQFRYFAKLPYIHVGNNITEFSRCRFSAA